MGEPQNGVDLEGRGTQIQNERKTKRDERRHVSLDDTGDRR